MTHLNKKIEKKFDWDDIDTGNFQLDHSQNFFARKHIKYENYDDLKGFVEENKENAISMFNALEHNDPTALSIDLNENKGAQPRKSELPAGSQQFKIKVENYGNVHIKELVCDSIPDNNENKEAIHTKSELPPGLQHLKIEDEISDNDRNPGDNRNNDVPNEISYSDEVLNEDYTDDASENKAIDKAVSNLATQPLAKNFVLEWSTMISKHKGVDAGGAAVVAPPRAYVFKDIYQQKKEEMQRMRMKEERKLREFHSRPAPNFKALHKQTQIKPVVHQVTCPVTPATLKTSRVTEERVKKKREECMRQQEVQRPKPRSIAYLQEQPFQPKHVAPNGSEQKPFRLHSDQRVKERREYNAVIQRAQEEKIKQEQEEREKREKDEIKELRKMTQFKARPNPFK